MTIRHFASGAPDNVSARRPSEVAVTLTADIVTDQGHDHIFKGFDGYLDRAAESAVHRPEMVRP